MGRRSRQKIKKTTPARLLAPAAVLLAARLSLADPTAAPAGPLTLKPPADVFASPEPGAPSTLPTVHVAAKLDAARDQIAPALGARTYKIGPDQIQSIPGGDNASFQQVLLRAPGVVQDSFGQEHVRGEHANLTYRVNGVLLPEPLSQFGQELDTRLIKSVTLVDGSLPAQFGFHTAGIVDVVTKSGDSLKSNELSLYGGSHGTVQPSLQLGGSDGRFDYFVTSSLNHNQLGIENPTAGHRALHDQTNQERSFGYFAYQLDDTSRLVLMLNASNSNFQIPNTPGVAPAFNLAGAPNANSSLLSETQNEQEYYGVVAYQKQLGDLALQLSGFSRYGVLDFHPDYLGDLQFQGVAGQVRNSFVTNGLQFDASYPVTEHHTLRFGAIADYTTEKLDTNTQVFPVDDTGAQTADTPSTVIDHSANRAVEAGVYLQDEFAITDYLTLNYGARYDRFDANFDHEGQLSPRANLVLKLDEKTTAHAGYSRYFVPPPVQDVRASTLVLFQNTTNAANSLVDTAPRVERSNYYDAGISRQVNKAWQVGVDGFYKESRQLVDLGQFGQALILSPFNYRRGSVYGAEFSTTYHQGGLNLFGNVAYVLTGAHDIDTQQYLFAADELAFIQNHNIRLDHDSQYTASAGASYNWKNDMVYADLLYGSGLRSGFANTGKEPDYYPINVGYQHVFRLDHANRNAVKLRFDVVNLFDQSYELRNGTGIGVGAAQYGARRGFFVGIAYDF